MATNLPVNMDTSITVKVQIQGSNRKFKLPLRDLLPSVFPQKLRSLLSIPDGQEVVFDRFSDSAAAYVRLDPENVQVYKTLMRAAKAKLKLRIRATVVEGQNEEAPAQNPVPTEPIPPPEAPKPRPASLALPFGAHSPRRSVYPMPNRQSLYDLKSSIVEPNKQPKKQLSTKVPEADREEDAPVPQSFPAPDSFLAGIAGMTRERELALRVKDCPVVAPLCSWSVYCNKCDNPMANEHYHCSICDEGDYDLCSSCVDAGVHCPGEGHWLIKRFVQNGKVINSTTERIAPKPKVEAENLIKPNPAFEAKTEMPGAFTEEKKPEPKIEMPSRTCNSCVKVFPEKEFVTCTNCEDFDLCIPCHVGSKHGHHPGHVFQPAIKETTIGPLAEFLCGSGRNVRHNAICDGCDKFIYGVRHKCLNCPDWDYCTKCIKSAKFIHPVHRFVPIYDPLPEPRSTAVRHYGIYCDGPLCKDKEAQTYIEGVRFKCAVCHDTDFCAACEAIPINRHNRTHPLIKFKTPVRNVSVTTMGEDKNGVAMATMGDQFQRKSVSTETLPVSSANAATQVQTIADLKPTEATTSRPAKQSNIKDLLAEPIKEKIKVQDLLVEPIEETTKAADTEPSKEIPASALNAHYIRDTVTDGTKMLSGSVFTQTWTMHNPGPHAWPAGCSVRYVGGDNMLNVDETRPSSATEISEATESNVITRNVEVGEDISFSVVMKAPKREGTAISYWRLKAADGTPFGHRLWCHINVTAAALPYETAAMVPTLQVNPQPIPQPENAGAYPHDYKMQLMLLELQNKARMNMVREREAALTRQAESRKALADAEKRHAEVRAQALENMRRTAAMIDGDLKKITSDVANLGLSSHAVGSEAAPVQDIAPNVETTNNEVEHMAKQPVVELESKAPAQQATVESAPPSPTHNSAMIFPTLEKESPVSSTHEAQPPISPPPASVAATARTEELEIFEDAESVEFFDESESDEDGFVTDEEYDILDASDEEGA